MASAAGGISRGHLPPEDSDLSTIGLCHSYEHVQKLLQSFEMDDQENPGHETAYQMLTRCGLDIGSGEHKAVIATVDAETGKIHEVLYEKAHQVLLQCDIAASGNKCLSPEIIKKSDDTLQLLKEKCIEFGVDSNNVRGVCTAVFRRAENGPDQVRKINEVFSYGGDGKMDKAVNKFVNRRKGIARAVEAKETDPPFDDAKKISTTPAKDQFGNIIKNRAKHLARQAAKKAGGDMGDKK